MRASVSSRLEDVDPLLESQLLEETGEGDKDAGTVSATAAVHEKGRAGGGVVRQDGVHQREEGYRRIGDDATLPSQKLVLIHGVRLTGGLLK